MRISDWSSDVCSSDLFLDSAAAVRTCPPHLTQSAVPMRICPIGGGLGFLCYHDAALCERRIDRREALARVQRGEAPTARSEEHTSELQSLMRISYAVFCLKKKRHMLSTSQTSTLYHIHL